MRALVLVCIGFLVLAPCLQTGGHGIPGAHSEGYISDVIVVDLQCEENLKLSSAIALHQQMIFG